MKIFEKSNKFENFFFLDQESDNYSQTDYLNAIIYLQSRAIKSLENDERVIINFPKDFGLTEDKILREMMHLEQLKVEFEDGSPLGIKIQIG